ncbi:glutathione ABC transporter substrate-binding protein [Alteribacter lacisalsi]|uniref:Glutathione ABC transporter substrate-binding protein n=1 Tax=Alteribacter lacisalsi TaxID=2045244 RepID=A0A2W0HDX2_9BACI|nr:glutathione ABC transporter substrate-binding protein [Alteribacter lacisalsi]PYZ99061.1 glutathione ABC transporter substrate-binding protein [Alteribacter lacisalsi]
MFKSKTLKATAVSVALATALAACASEPDEDGGDAGGDAGDGGEETGEEDDEEAGGEEGGDLVIGVLSDINSLDPHTSNDVPSGQMQTQIYETLTKFDENMELEPYLAESWEDVEEDVWRFELVEGVTFHDGSEFNAEVVEANIERILDEEIGSPRAILFDVIEEITVVDDYTIEFRTEVPFAPLPSHFAHYASSIISKESIEGDYAAMEDDGAQPGEYINDNPYGTGFFEFEERASGDFSKAVRFEDYWGENAKVDSVELRVMPESSSRIGELTNGGIHIGDPLEANDINRVEGTDDVGYFMTEGASISYLGFNMEKEPFDDARVRRALSLALDTESMVDSILEGTGERANGPINQTQFGYNEDIPVVEQNLEEARELLAEAGYEDGFETTLWTNDSAEREQIAQVAQANFEEIGVDVTIEVVEWGAYLDATGAGEHDMFILGLSLGTGDADYPMHMLFHSENAGPTGNRSFMRDETFDDLLYQARIEQDEDARLDLYTEAVEYLQEEAPMAFLYHPAQIMGVHDSVEGYWADGSGIYQLQDVTINN